MTTTTTTLASSADRTTRFRTPRPTPPVPVAYTDPGSGVRVLVTTPGADPRRWADYLAGAVRQYRAHGVECVLDLDVIADGATTSLVFLALDDDGTVVGGVRAQGPYTSAAESHAVLEWAGDPGLPQVRAMIDDRVPFGVVEGKSAWVGDGVVGRSALVRCLSRAPVHAADLLGARYALGTSAEHTLGLWTASGAVVCHDVDPVPYPDARYATRLVWWDRWAPTTGVTPVERRALAVEGAQLGLRTDAVAS